MFGLQIQLTSKIKFSKKILNLIFFMNMAITARSADDVQLCLPVRIPSKLKYSIVPPASTKILCQAIIRVNLESPLMNFDIVLHKQKRHSEIGARPGA